MDLWIGNLWTPQHWQWIVWLFGCVVGPLFLPWFLRISKYSAGFGSGEFEDQALTLPGSSDPIMIFIDLFFASRAAQIIYDPWMCRQCKKHMDPGILTLFSCGNKCDLTAVPTQNQKFKSLAQGGQRPQQLYYIPLWWTNGRRSRWQTKVPANWGRDGVSFCKSSLPY